MVKFLNVRNGVKFLYYETLTERWGFFCLVVIGIGTSLTRGILSGNSYYIGGAKSRQNLSPRLGNVNNFFL